MVLLVSGYYLRSLDYSFWSAVGVSGFAKSAGLKMFAFCDIASLKFIDYILELSLGRQCNAFGLNF